VGKLEKSGHIHDISRQMANTWGRHLIESQRHSF